MIEDDSWIRSQDEFARYHQEFLNSRSLAVDPTEELMLDEQLSSIFTLAVDLDDDFDDDAGGMINIPSFLPPLRFLIYPPICF